MNQDCQKPAPISILLLDDEPSVVFALRLLLETIGYTVNDFSAPDRALDFLRSGAPSDLFLCDLRMPGMTGLAVLEEARKIRPALPFILMSAHANPQEVDQAKSLGASGFLAKPFTPEAIHKVVRDFAAAKS